MLTGAVPFTTTDPLELIHCHVARQPASPAGQAPGVPEQIAAIVLKLLSKNAEERYQTAAGVEADLRACLRAWESTGTIDPFPLGAHDVPDQLRLPEKLYGRERDLATLLAAFDQVAADGTTRLVLVSGAAEVGKSSVVHQLRTVVGPPRGLFASGKLDQYRRDVPYTPLAQAIQGLVRWILGQGETELERWRDAIREAVGPNGQLIVNLVPELEVVIGQQPAVPRSCRRRMHTAASER
jgi:serine/threonine protein kinase